MEVIVSEVNLIRTCLDSNLPSSEGRLGDIGSTGDEEAGSFPLDDGVLDMCENAGGLDEELEGVECDELSELDAAFRLPAGIGTEEEAIMRNVDVDGCET